MSSGPGGRRLIILAKEPRPGRVKTRLARDIGAIDAAGWYRRQLRTLISRLGRDPRWQTVLAVSPDCALNSPVWQPVPRRKAQGRGNLGDRMARALAAEAPQARVLIGGDIPGITPGHIARAFRCLGRHDAVLGPAEDGGYWLIGLGAGVRLPAHAFSGVRWSGPHALTDTIASLAPLRIALTDRLADVDTAADLAKLQSR